MTLVKVTVTGLRAIVVVPRQAQCLAPYSFVDDDRRNGPGITPAK